MHAAAISTVASTTITQYSRYLVNERISLQRLYILSNRCQRIDQIERQEDFYGQSPDVLQLICRHVASTRFLSSEYRVR